MGAAGPLFLLRSGKPTPTFGHRPINPQQPAIAPAQSVVALNHTAPTARSWKEPRMQIDKGCRIGGYVVLRDREGLRYAIRPGALLALSDGDPCQDSTVLQLPGGRMVMVDEPLERILAWLDGPNHC